MTFALLVILLLGAFVVWSLAATVTNERDIMSNQTISGTSAHQISFNLSGTNTFAAGEVIAIDFPVGFTQGGTWAAGDFTFTDGASRTVVDVDAGAGTSTVDACTAGANNIGIAIDTTDLVFRVIACSGFTASSTGAFVTFTIDGTTPNGTLTNPSSANTYAIYLTDAAGDCGAITGDCSMSVAIISSSQVSVTASVTGVCGNSVIEPGETCDDGNTTPGDGCSATCQTEGGGGGGGEPADTTPPVISGIVVSGITTSAATVGWTTNEAATSLVRYGLTASYGSTSSQAAYITTHSQSLTGLVSGTTYHYQVCSTDSPGNQACSTDQTFTTLDTTPPVISNVQVTSITTTGATITWTTNEASNSNVDYDLDGPAYDSNATDASMVTSHSIVLTGLSSGTTYHYRVRSADASANESFTSDATFTTASPPDVTPPVISNIQVTGITETTATVTWTTNENSDSKVDHGLTASYGTTTTNPSMVLSHSVTLTGLTASTQYHFRVRSSDAAANEATSLDNTFTTAAPPDVTPPVISNVQVTGITATGATITWTTNEAATRFVDYGLTASYGSSAGTASPLQTSHSVTLTGLTNGTTYHFRARSADAAANSGTSTDATFTTLDTVPPVISNVQVTGITATGATITWTTNEAATRFVDYGLTASYGSSAGTASPLQTSHSVTLTGLTGATQYHYRVRSADASANSASSADATFTTLVPPDVTPPVISNVQVVDVTANSARITWTTDEASDSRVEYDTDGSPYASNKSDAAMVTSHSVTITGLSEATQYHYRVMSKDATNNQAATTDALFSTLDASAPVITNVVVSGITQTGATITWTTNELADSYIDYGTTSGYGSTTGTDTDVTSHSVTLSGLTLGTTYHYRVVSTDPQGNATTTLDATFTTLDTTPPVLSSINVTNITPTSATVTWTTDENSDSTVEYGPTVSYGSTQAVATPVKTHTVDLTGLTPDTTYNYRVKSKDASANEAVSSNLTFKTVKPPPPVISNVQVAGVTETTATITWNTDVLSDSKVDFGQTVSYGSTRSDATMTVTHSVTVTGLNLASTYHFRVRSTGQYAQTTSSSDSTFTTLADTTPTGPASGFTAVAGNSSVTLSWTNPIDPDFNEVLIVRKTGSAPTGPSDGTVVYTGTGTSFANTGLANDNTYYYAVYAFDLSGNASTGSFASATPQGPKDFTAPADIENFVAGPGDQQILLTWTLPSDGDWVGVKIQRKTSGYPTDVNDGVTVFNATGSAKLDTGLTNGQVYYYRAFSFDGSLNYTAGVTVSAVPTSGTDTTPPGPVTDFVASAGDGEVQLSWVNPTDADWAATRVIRKTGSAPTGPNDGTLIIDGPYDNWLNYGLTNDVTYYYAAYAYDPSSNFATPAFASATPTAGAVPEALTCVDSDGGANVNVKGSVTAGEDVYQDSCSNGTTVREYTCEAQAPVETLVDCSAGFKCSAGRCIADTTIADFEVCGNGVCVGSENSINCPIDCPVETVVEYVPVPEKGQEDIAAKKVLESGVKFFVTSGKLTFEVIDGVVRTYTRMAITVYVPDEALLKEIEGVFLTIGGKTLAMRQIASYSTTFLSPEVESTQDMTVIVKFKDGSTASAGAVLQASPRGRVYETIDGEKVGVAGAQVALYVEGGNGSYGLWDGSSTDQNNPQVTDDLGRYSFVVPKGNYKLVASKDGYVSKETLPFPLRGSTIINNSLVLFEEPKNALDAVGTSVGVAAEQFREVVSNDFVEEGTQRVAPAAAAVAVANVASAGAATATAVPYLLYLYSFLAQPTLLIARRRRKQWGVVFDAITKDPVDLAIVRLTDAATGRIVRSMVTDKEGRYFFIAQQGTYRITVAKAGFVFPTAYMKGMRQGVRYSDLYHGEDITVEQETAITANIPVDPVEKEKTPKRVLWEGIGRRFQKSISIISIAAMGIAVVITPTPLVVGMFVGNILLYGVFRRIAVGKKPKSWGIVYDEKTKRPVRNAIVRVFEAKYNKLLETQVTDIRGRYAFLVGNNVYYVTYERPGYKKRQKGPLDLMDVTDEKKKVIADDMPLEAEDESEDGGGKKRRRGSLLVPTSGNKAAVSLPALGDAVDKRGDGEIPAPMPAKEGGASDVAAAAPSDKPKKSLLVGPGESAPEPEQKGAESASGTEKGTGGNIPWELQQLMGGAKKDDASPSEQKPAPTPPGDAAPKNNIPWELQQLMGGAKKEDGAPATESTEPAREDAAPAPNAPEPVTDAPTEEPPNAEASKDDASLETKKSDAAHSDKPSKYHEPDAEGFTAGYMVGGELREIPEVQKFTPAAHPEIKLIQDAAHAHPDEARIENVLPSPEGEQGGDVPTGAASDPEPPKDEGPSDPVIPTNL